ncbi:TetR family transcriptional regulator [Curtobacterium sp. UNCCL17]|uniref:TetR family transcriptional regulator n=1 Tax=Curtobacterium sp. UNCCL17 TaxID=1449051 RepID=UPI0004814E9D|nr:TetR/AcrR family transcriptional regulator [Curtobacterium sp. UNCCL17]
MNEPEAPTIRERSRRAMRDELTMVAQDLFLDRGFDQVTVDQIAEVAGVSKRTLFRYFASKEDIVVGSYERYGDRLAAGLDQRPATEPVWDSLWAIFTLMASQEAAVQDRTRGRALEQIVHSTPQLTARFLEKIQMQQQALVGPVRSRLAAQGVASADPRAAAIVGAAFACLYAARSSWLVSDPAEHFREHLDRAMASVTSVG